MAEPRTALKVVFWGTYDLGKPRVRLLLAGARAAGMEIIECHASVWEGVDDKSQLCGFAARWRRLWAWLSAYPSLIWRYLHLPRHDVVVVSYLGHLDILILWPFARWRGVPIVWDVFLSLYDTIVRDRCLVSKYSPVAWGVFAWEWLASRAADKIFLDTSVHARYFEELFHLPTRSVGRVWVGAETEIFTLSLEQECQEKAQGGFTVLFYGQFIPLHGIDTIVKAAQRVEATCGAVRWLIIGRGQEEGRIDALIRQLGIHTVKRIPWVPYEQLAKFIREADACLGIFGTSGKAMRVIPNKVYQILAAGRPLITADTPAIRELVREGPGIYLVPPGSVEGLASTVLKARAKSIFAEEGGRGTYKMPVVGPTEVGCQLKQIIEQALCKS